MGSRYIRVQKAPEGVVGGGGGAESMICIERFAKNHFFYFIFLASVLLKD